MVILLRERQAGRQVKEGKKGRKPKPKEIKNIRKEENKVLYFQQKDYRNEV